MTETSYEVMRRQGITRRSFLKFCSLTASALGLGPAFVPRIAEAMETKQRIPVLWLHGLECTCCSESFIRSAHPLAKDVVLSMISLDYDDTIMAAAGHQAETIIEETIEKYEGNYILTFERFPELDRQGRPKMFYSQRIHDKCYRRPHFDAGQFVESWDDEGARKGYCLYKMGCKKVSLHQTGFQEVLAMAEMLGDYPSHLLLVGVQPVELEDYGGSLRPAVKAQIQPSIDLALEYLAALGVKAQRRFGFSTWPALVFMRNNEHLGTITQVQNWDDYLRDIGQMLESGPLRAPGFSIPVVTRSASNCH